MKQWENDILKCSSDSVVNAFQRFLRKSTEKLNYIFKNLIYSLKKNTYACEYFVSLFFVTTVFKPNLFYILFAWVSLHIRPLGWNITGINKYFGLSNKPDIGQSCGCSQISHKYSNEEIRRVFLRLVRERKSNYIGISEMFSSNLFYSLSRDQKSETFLISYSFCRKVVLCFTIYHKVFYHFEHEIWNSQKLLRISNFYQCNT